MSAINVSVRVARGGRRPGGRIVEVTLEWGALPTWVVGLDDARDLHRDLGRVIEAAPRLAPSVDRWSATPGRMPTLARLAADVGDLMATTADAGPPDGPYSRAVWLPVVGPTAWLVWGTAATMVAGGDPIELSSDELAQLHGVGTPALARSLSRLRSFGLAGGSGDDRWTVRLTCPPLWGRLVGRIPAASRAVHDELFPPAP